MLALGAKGVISVMANIVPQQTHQLCADFFAGNVQKSAQAQTELTGLIRALFAEPNPIPVKAAQQMMGFDVGLPRRPLVKAGKKCVKELERQMKKLRLI